MTEGTDNFEYMKFEPFLDGWNIIRKIGQGSIGRVCEIARDNGGCTERAALKIICLPDGPDEIKRAISNGISKESLPAYYESLTQSFVSEYEFMKRLRGNDHIVTYGNHKIIPHEDGVGNDILIRMELLEPLIDHTLDNEMDEEDVLRLGLDIADALMACEEAGVLHRDIKPDNIFVSEGGGYKLGDFGVARIIEETEMNLSHKGTVAYMAPEVYRGEPSGMASDIYSLGLVMYKYLNNGRLPFMPDYPEEVGYDDSEKALGRRVRKEMPAPPENGSSGLKAVVLKACAPDPADRYQSAAEFSEDLRNVEKGLQPILADAALKGAENFAGPRIPTGMKTAAAAVLVLALAAWLIWYSIPKEITDITGIESGEEIYIGESVAPEYAVEPAWFEDEEIEFASSDEDVFSADTDGSITAAGVGEAELIISARDYTKSVRISVVPKVSEIGGVENELSLTEGETMQLEPVLSPPEFSDEAISYSTKDADVAAVTGDGLIVGVAPGTTTLEITSGGCTREAEITVEAEPEPEPEPVYYNSYNTGGSAADSASSGGKKSGSRKSSDKSKSKKSDSGAEGYIDDIDDEYFD